MGLQDCETLVNILYSNCCQYTGLSLSLPALYQISDGVMETFEMINSTTDPCGRGTLLSVLTLAYCNVITIKLYIDQGGTGEIKTTSTHQQSTQSFIIIVFPIPILRDRIIMNI